MVMRRIIKLLIAKICARFRPLFFLKFIRRASLSSNLFIHNWGRKWIRRFDPDVLRKVTSTTITQKQTFFESEYQGNLILELSEHIDYTIFMQGYFDKFILENFILNRSKEVILIDVGANIGAISISAALQGVQVIAFEPSPAICKKFSANIKANSLDNIILNQTALGNQYQANSGIIDFYVQPANSGTSSALRAWNPGKQVPKIIQIVISTLDDYIDSNSLVHRSGQEWILKIDVEGMELNVLEGAKKFLTEFNPVIVMEWRQDLINSPLESRNALNANLPNYTFYSGKSFSRGLLQEFEYDKTEENIVGFKMNSNNPLI